MSHLLATYATLGAFFACLVAVLLLSTGLHDFVARGLRRRRARMTITVSERVRS